uniref:Uncharacterized protein n=1 Tax=Parascaris univalens TaxID=6257 RepID=A0A915A419_PARUN
CQNRKSDFSEQIQIAVKAFVVCHHWSDTMQTFYSEECLLSGGSASPDLSNKAIRRKVIAFWCTAAVILVLSLLLLIGISFLAWYRLCILHHALSEVFCPKE